MGSSPLTRGKRYRRWPGVRRLRLIPAHAGKTQRTSASLQGPGAHPRSRGENTRRSALQSIAGGSSPLTRGKPCAPTRSSAKARLIPAHAGKTTQDTSPNRWQRAHPRSRGENASLGPSSAARWRLIPAHAGKTPASRRRAPSAQAHPRSRGENRARRDFLVARDGSSPLTRGKPTPAAA